MINWVRRQFGKGPAVLSMQRLGGQTLVALGLKVCNAVASFALSLLIARSFGADGTGRFGVAVTTMTLISYVVICGMNNTVIRNVAGDLRENSPGKARGTVRLAATSVVVAFGLLAIIFLGARETLMKVAFGSIDASAELYIMLLAVLPLALQRIASSALRASGNVFVSQVIDGPLGTTVTAVGMLAFVVFGTARSLVTPAILYLAGLIIACGCGWFFYRRIARHWPAPIRPALSPFIIAGVPVLVADISNIFTEWYTIVSLGNLWPTAIVGQYRAAWQFVALASMVQVAMLSILGPRIAGAARVGNLADIAAAARKTFVLMLVLLTPLFLVMLVLAEELLGLFGPEFVAGAPALRILVIGQFFRTLGSPFGSILVMTGNQRWILAYAFLGIIPCVALVAILVPGMGAEGAAWATSATALVRVVSAALIVNSVLKIKVFKR